MSEKRAGLRPPTALTACHVASLVVSCHFAPIPPQEGISLGIASIGCIGVVDAGGSDDVFQTPKKAADAADGEVCRYTIAGVLAYQAPVGLQSRWTM